MILASPRVFDDADIEHAELLRRQLIAAMRNHYWLKHAEANGRNIEEVDGKSAVFDLQSDGRISDWEIAAELFAEEQDSQFPKEMPLELVDWAQRHIAEFPLQSIDLNRAEFAVGREGNAPLRVVFLGHRSGRHRLLLYRPRCVPEFFGLTKREKETLSWLCHGYENKDIATVLGISQHTVRNHLENIFRKLHVAKRTEAASMARGWFED